VWRGTNKEVDQVLHAIDEGESAGYPAAPGQTGGSVGDFLRNLRRKEEYSDDPSSFLRVVLDAVEYYERLGQNPTAADIRRAVLTVLVPGPYWSWK
jgi:hypothetical protein